MDTYKTDPEISARMERISKYNFHFENLAFESGGAKMAAYTGTVKILEELGILQKCKRFAGTSGGAIIAALLATRHTADEVKEAMSLPMKDLVYDSWWGWLSFIPNMMKRFGWNPAKKFRENAKRIMANKTGDPNITFEEVYNRYGTELCIVATNVTTSSPEYFHMKTTPTMTVAEALHCSIAIPVLMQPVEVQIEGGMKQMFVDGGLVDSYPLHVYDGWYLSMKKEDSFFSRMENNDHPFGTHDNYNKNSLGFVLFTLWKKEFGIDEFLKRRPLTEFQRPDTKLARKKRETADKLIKEHGGITSTLENGKIFMKILHGLPETPKDGFTFDDFSKALDKMKSEHPERAEQLFGDSVNMDVIKKRIDDRGGKVTTDNFISILQRDGITWSQFLNGSCPFKPKNMKDFYKVLMNSSMQITRNAYCKPYDIDRSVGIFTDYIATGDFKLETEDLDFLIREGQMAAVQYFHQLVQRFENNELEHMKEVLTLASSTVQTS